MFIERIMWMQYPCMCSSALALLFQMEILLWNIYQYHLVITCIQKGYDQNIRMHDPEHTDLEGGCIHFSDILSIIMLYSNWYILDETIRDSNL